MAFSDQFYFVAAALTYGSLLAVYGAAAAIYNAYQLYRDNLFVPLCLLMMIMCWSMEIICVKLGRYAGLWFREGEEERLEKDEIKKQRDGVSVEESKNEDINQELVSANDEAISNPEDKNLQYRALTQIGMSESKLQGLDSRLADIHNLPAGFTAAEMSFRLLDDIFSEVLQSWHTNQIGAEGTGSMAQSMQSKFGVSAKTVSETEQRRQNLQQILQQRAGQKQLLFLGDVSSGGPVKEQLLSVEAGQDAGSESKMRAGEERWRKIRGSVRYHAALDAGVKGFPEDGNKSAKGKVQEGEISSKEAPPASKLVPACFAKSKMYRGWLYDFEDEE